MKVRGSSIQLQLLLFVVGMAFSTCYGLQCYNCTFSDMFSTNPTCKGPNINSEYLVTCPSGSTHCVASVISTSFGMFSATTMKRSCHKSDNPARCLIVRAGEQAACSCTFDGCNNWLPKNALSGDAVVTRPTTQATPSTTATTVPSTAVAIMTAQSSTDSVSTTQSSVDSVSPTLSERNKATTSGCDRGSFMKINFILISVVCSLLKTQ